MKFAHNPRRGMLFSFLAFSSWACADALVKYTGASVSIWAMGFYDLIVIIAFMAALGLWGGFGTLREAVTTRLWRWHALRGCIICAQFLAEMYGFTHMSLARTYTLLFTMPLLTVPLSFLFMGEKAGLKKWAAITMGFSGVLIVLRPGLIPLDLAAMLTLFSATNFSVANLIARHIGKKGEESPLASAFISQVVCFICTVPLYFMHYSMPGLHDMLLIVLIGIFTGIGFMLLTTAFAMAPAATVAPLHYSQMLWATLFGYLFFADVPDKWVLAGAGVIIASGLWLIRQEKAVIDALPDKITAPAPVE
ncbi:MAG TPA: DMT family transporter [Patescibacteria group bacterium]|nr:DMT family transporter [Patescibacteria group bacterium]